MLRVWSAESMNPVLATFKTGLACAIKPGLAAMARLQQAFLVASVFLIQYPGKKGQAYNILWVLVFGFATLNILGLVARKFEPDRNRMSFGEFLAIMVVVISVILLALELLNIMHIFPIRLKPR